MSHLLAEYVVSANCWLQSKFSRKKYWHRQHESVSVALCWQKHDSSQQLLHDCWWTGVLWVVWWLIVVFDGNSCSNSVGLGLMIDDWSWLMVGFDDNSCWAAVKNDWQLTGVTWLMGTGGYGSCGMTHSTSVLSKDIYSHNCFCWAKMIGVL